jgi:hypothetical protein
VHVMNGVHGVDVDSGEPVHHLFELAADVVKVEVVAFYRLEGRAYLLPLISSRPPLMA